MTSDELIALLGDILIPAAAILTSVAIAIGLAKSERRAAASARHRENLGRVGEKVVEALVPFVSLDPIEELWAPYLRTLRARILSFQIIAQTSTEVEVGAWLAVERDRGARLMRRAMLALDKAGGADASLKTRSDEMAPVRDWSDLVTRMFAGFLIDRKSIDDVRARLESPDVEWYGQPDDLH